jgi:hypothetical protein
MSARLENRAARMPLPRLAAVYAISLPLAWVLTPQSLPWEAGAASCAVALGWILGLAPWWLAINALFVPALAWGLTLELSPWWPLAALGVLVAVYGRIWASRVPLFFTTARAQDALAQALPKEPIAFLDAGCGDARVIAGLAAARPDSRFEGIEHALVPWLLGCWRSWRDEAPFYVRRGDLWAHGLTQYDVVYAYLSPAVMPRFWEKAKREMRPGALLVSAFEVPGMREGRYIEVDDAMRTRLHVCRIGAEGAA